MLETIVTAALTAAIIQLLPYGWRRVREIKRVKIAQPAKDGVTMVRLRPPTPKLDSFRATSRHYLNRITFPVTEEDLRGIDSFLARGYVSDYKFTPQEIDALLTGTDTAPLSSIWPSPDTEYVTKQFKEMDERRRFVKYQKRHTCG
jgi:hypothetical protein